MDEMTLLVHLHAECGRDMELREEKIASEFHFHQATAKQIIILMLTLEAIIRNCIDVTWYNGLQFCPIRCALESLD